METFCLIPADGITSRPHAPDSLNRSFDHRHSVI